MADSFFSTVVDSSVGFIQFYKQTKPRLQLQAMLTRKVNGELLVISSVKFRHLRTIQDCILDFATNTLAELWITAIIHSANMLQKMIDYLNKYTINLIN